MDWKKGIVWHGFFYLLTFFNNYQIAIPNPARPL